MVDIQITYNCNNNCVSCIIPGEAYCSEEVSKEKLRKKLFEQDHKIITIGGGEPTTDPDFLKFVDFALRTNPDADFRLLTNGRMFYYQNFARKFNSIIEKYDNTFEIDISLYGPEKIHEKITRTEDSFKQTLKGIKNLVKEGFIVNIRVVVNKLNYEYMEETSQIINTLNGISNVIFIFSRYTGKAGKNIERTRVSYNESVDQVEKAVDKIEKNEGNIKLFHYPLCIIDKEYRFYAKTGITKDNGGVTFLERCKKCAARDKCSGIWESYLEEFGKKEFNPL